MQKRWVYKETGDQEIINKLTASLNIDPVLAHLLMQRGITTFVDARDFFRPSLDNLHDPFLIKDMDKAVKRIEQAFERDENILVYGDYDVDGTTAVALTYALLKEFYPKVDYYIPDRYKEGYGISFTSVDYAEKNGISLIISLDCGIKAYSQIEYARDKGIDFIVIDHHRPGETLPPALAMVDPKQDDCPYPYKELSGCGLGFKLAQAFYQKRNLPFDGLEKFLDLVVVSIAADIVPITGENRIMAYFGLRRINTNPCPGLESILLYSNIFKKAVPDEKTMFTREIGITDLMFLVGPKINAAGRIEKGKKAVDLLLCEKMGETHELSQHINDNNTERRTLDTEITRQALKMIKTDPNLKESKATVLFDPEWHKGVIGIVASRLIENYYRPTIILTESNGMITGSARSVKGFDIYDAIDACSDYLEHFGGHKYAAGLSLKPENFERFKKAFKEVVETTITEEMLIPQISIDGEINLNAIEGKFFRILKQFAPFGPGNSNPVFVSRECAVKGTARLVGKNHLKFNVYQPGNGLLEMPAIAFQQGHQLEYLTAGKLFDLAYQIEENEWNGKIYLQLNVKDIKFYDA
jgi:single-stranded-DNA-specific exonuclease